MIMKNESKRTGLEIAVIGMAGKFPGARNINELWENLKNGVESISFFTDEELKAAGVSQDVYSNPNYVRARGIIDGRDVFDHNFFDYIPSEARAMDPQMRLFHECTWDAMENAGYHPDNYEGLIGVYAGASHNIDWEARTMLSKEGQAMGEYELSQLSNKDYLATRVSYKLNLKGPSVVVQTACSTSLVAVHMACRALITGECDMAVAGGITLYTAGKFGYLHQEGMILSPDGHCRAFDARARGTVGGEGIGIVILKRLKDAETDGDTVLAVVKGTAINNDGIDKVGYTAPSVEGQYGVIKKAHRLARFESESITYVETHGTGTVLGDPIEIKALKLAFDTDKKNYCALGSVKTNVGHLDSAAGVIGFIKVVLCLQYKTIPPSLHYESNNPSIDFENSPFYVNRQLKEWKNDEYPLRAGISSFGIGGTNSHAVLEEAMEGKEQRTVVRQCQLIPLSAKTSAALEKIIRNLDDYLDENHSNSEFNFIDAVYTLQVGRKAFKHRAVLTASTVREAVDRLQSPDGERLQFHVLREGKYNIIFMFPGQGSQYVEMAGGLYRTEPVFRQEMDRCLTLLKSHIDYDLKGILYSGGNSPDTSDSDQINRTEITQPVIFSVEYALAKLLMSWGISPRAMIGHSIGEYTAACLSGVFSLDDALKIVAARGRSMQGMPGGAMLSVPISEEELIPLLKENHDISLAAVNCSALCVLSGPFEAVEEIEMKLEHLGYRTRRLHTSHAFHSRMMDPIINPFIKEVDSVTRSKPIIPFVSNVTGNWITTADAVDPQYWGRQIRQTVRFVDGITLLMNDSSAPSIFIEIGPGKALSTFVRQHTLGKKREHRVVNLLRHPQEDIPDIEYLMSRIGQLWLYGIIPDWKAFHSDEKRYRIPLPTYPFQGRELKLEGNLMEMAAGLLKKRFLLGKKTDIADWFYVPLWEQSPFNAPAVVPGSPCGSHYSRWIIFEDTVGLGAKIRARLEQKGAQVISVKAGDYFGKEGKGEFVLNPQEENHYQRLFDELSELKESSFKILHLWSVNRENNLTIGEIDRYLYAGFYSLLFIVRAMGEVGISSDIDIEIISNHLHRITGEEELCPVKAAILGAVRTIPLEYQNLRCRSIDVTLPQPGSPNELLLLNRLMEQLDTIFPGKDTVLAIRGDFRWIQTVKPFQLETTGNSYSPLLKEKGVYLIIGGTGGIGLTIAEALARDFSARLILTGRSVFPPREKWEKWLKEHDETDKIGCKIRKVMTLEQLGAEILIISADTADEEQVEALIREAEKKFGLLNGVFHAAGLADYAGIIQKRSIETTGDILAPKIKGTLVLEKIFKDRPLDFFVLFSSTASLLPTFGQVAYTAANRFLDNYAQFTQSLRSGQQGKGRRTVSINWDAWQEAGMAVDAAKHSGNISEEVLKYGITPKEGVEALYRILTHSLPQVVVSPVDFETVLKNAENPENENENSNGTSEPASLQRPELNTPYISPRSEVEKVLSRIWARFFGLQLVGCNDDFSELGGDSLKAMTLITWIQKEMNVRVPLPEFFRNASIKGVASYIEKAAFQQFKAIEPIEKREYYELSSAQKRLFLLQQMEPGGTAYNMPEIIPLDEFSNTEKLTNTIKQLIERHESLRTSFIIIDEEPVQRVYDHVEPDIDMQPDIAQFVRPFDLSNAPLLRVGLLKTGEDSHLLMVDMHHIMADGISQQVLANDFISLLDEKELPLLSIQYKDFARWQNEERRTGYLKQQETYWLSQFAGEIPSLKIPHDFPRPPIQGFEGNVLEDKISCDPVDIKSLAKETGITTFMLFLAVYNIFLSKISGQEDIVVGTPAAGRNHADLQQIIGMFVNTLVLRNYPEREKTFAVFLEEVRDNTLKAFNNQDYQFEDLVEKLVSKRDKHNPLFDVMFRLVETEDTGSSTEESEARKKAHQYLPRTSKFDLTLSIEFGKNLLFSFEYSTELFKEDTIRIFSDCFKGILQSILSNRNIKIKDIKATFDLSDTNLDVMRDELTHLEF
jgi:acyl transferase domain-containing protein/acyl carrier protein